MARNKLTNIKIYEIDLGDYGNKSKWIELPINKYKKKEALERMNFLNKIPLNVALHILKEKHLKNK